MGKVAAARRSAADAGTKRDASRRAVATVPKRAIKKRPPPGAELLHLIEQLPPGRYRVIMNVAKIGKRKGREITLGVGSFAVDVKVPKPRRPAIEAAEPAPAAALKGDPQDDETP